MIRFRRIVFLLITLALIFMAGIPGADAAVHTVSPSGADFTNIQAAVDWAYPGDTVRVQSGIYTEEILLDKKIALIGIDNGGGIPVIDAGQKGNAIEVRVDGCVVDGFSIRNSTLFSGIRISSSNNTIARIQYRTRKDPSLSAMKNTIYGNTISGSSGSGFPLRRRITT
jgi:nitrous oxidase accessory protein NosD